MLSIQKITEKVRPCHGTVDSRNNVHNALDGFDPSWSQTTGNGVAIVLNMLAHRPPQHASIYGRVKDPHHKM